MHAILSYCIYSAFFFSQMLVSFSFLSSFPFNSIFRFPWLQCFCFIFPIFMVTILFIQQLNPCSFLFLPLFSPTILLAASIQQTPITCWPLSSGWGQVGSIPLLGFMSNFLIVLVKDDFPYTITTLSLPKMVKPSLIFFVFTFYHALNGSYLPSSHFW